MGTKFKWISGRDDIVSYEDGGAIWWNLYDRSGLVYTVTNYYGEHWEEKRDQYVLSNKHDVEIMTWPDLEDTRFEDIAKLAEEVIEDIESGKSMEYIFHKKNNYDKILRQKGKEVKETREAQEIKEVVNVVWPEGYAKYDAFIWENTIYMKELIWQAIKVLDTDGSWGGGGKKAPKGYVTFYPTGNATTHPFWTGNDNYPYGGRPTLPRSLSKCNFDPVQPQRNCYLKNLWSIFS